ncbi:hypothetical protein CABS03_09492 [Colletotrichum abscissum]
MKFSTAAIALLAGVVAAAPASEVSRSRERRAGGSELIQQLQSTFDRNNPNGTPAAAGDPDDLNGDGVINVFEAGAQASKRKRGGGGNGGQQAAGAGAGGNGAQAKGGNAGGNANNQNNAGNAADEEDAAAGNGAAADDGEDAAAGNGNANAGNGNAAADDEDAAAGNGGAAADDEEDAAAGNGNAGNAKAGKNKNAANGAANNAARPRPLATAALSTSTPRATLRAAVPPGARNFSLGAEESVFHAAAGGKGDSDDLDNPKGAGDDSEQTGGPKGTGKGKGKGKNRSKGKPSSYSSRKGDEGGNGPGKDGRPDRSGDGLRVEESPAMIGRPDGPGSGLGFAELSEFFEIRCDE